MSADPEKSGLAQKVKHETKEIILVFGYLASYFCALSVYRTLLLEQNDIPYFTFGTALLNAFIITKVILIGEAARLGKRGESKPIIYSAIYKAVVYGALVFAFHMVEEIVKMLFQGKEIAGAFHEVRLDDLLVHSVVIIITFIPFFAFRELGRILGKDKFRALVFGAGANESHRTPIV